MERERVICLVECEILRKIGLSKLCGKEEAKQHMEVANALSEVLDKYKIIESEKKADLFGGNPCA